MYVQATGSGDARSSAKGISSNDHHNVQRNHPRKGEHSLQLATGGLSEEELIPRTTLFLLRMAEYTLPNSLSTQRGQRHGVAYNPAGITPISPLR